MTNQEIISYFGGGTVYKFHGSLAELQQLQENHGVGFNCLRVQDEVYFISQNPAVDSRITTITGN